MKNKENIRYLKQMRKDYAHRYPKNKKNNWNSIKNILNQMKHTNPCKKN